MKFVHTLMAASLALTLAGQAQAAVSPAEAAKLGAELTLVGAEKAANADGSIPAYAGGLITPPASFQAGSSMRPDPFADEKPLLVIDGKNVEQYKDQLTAVSFELAKRYPGFRMEVYPTHRSASIPQGVLDNSLKNATSAKLAALQRYLAEVDDAEAVAAWLQEEYPNLPVTLLGFSFGGFVAAALGARTPRCRGAGGPAR